MRHWAAVESGLAGTYGLSARAVARTGMRRLMVLIGGLPADSRFAAAWRRTPRHITDPAEIARLTGR